MKVDHSDYGTVSLLPSPYEIQWNTWFGVSLLIESSGFATRKAGHIMDLQAEHTYILKANRTTG